ncbi:hypothetical protein SAMN05216436_10466 [bacterium A37T11]|nr:hypothetical protein SAMN05216436_10466 [bacterium A37T11]
MIVFIRKYLFVVTLGICSGAFAQTNTISPYSQFGLGEIKDDLLPQFRAMGGISTGIRYLGYYHNINVSNPASYGGIRMTSIDVGAYGNFSKLNKNSLSENSSSFALSHLNFAMPITHQSAVSFGLMPFTELGYKYSATSKLDTTPVNYVYSGEGGLSKAYMGYGIQLGKHLGIGANIGYIFGNLDKIQSTEYPYQVEAYNVSNKNTQEINGLSYDYGIQYFTNLSEKVMLTIGYSGTAGNRLNNKTVNVVTRTATSVTEDSENTALDSVKYLEGNEQKIRMPMTHRFGFSLASNKWVVGADAHFSSWSRFAIGRVNQNLKDSYGGAIGAQFTPNLNSLRYLNRMDYRLGLKYDKTYVNIRDHDINQVAITAGLGIPIIPRANIGAFYKINFSAEFGQRGTLNNSLVKERYLNINLGFTLNDRWFQRYQFD